MTGKMVLYLMMTLLTVLGCKKEHVPPEDPDGVLGGSFGPPNVDLVVSVSSSANPVSVGTLLNFTIKVANKPGNNPASTISATSVKAVWSAPPGNNYNFSSADPDCYPTNYSVDCYFGNLVSGASSSKVIKIVPIQAGTLSVMVTVSSKEQDGDMRDNQASISITVTGQ